MMPRASFLEVPAHVFGLRLKILRYFRSGWLRVRFSSAAVGSSPLPCHLARLGIFGVRIVHHHFGRWSTVGNPDRLVGRSLFPPTGGGRRYSFKSATARPISPAHQRSGRTYRRGTARSKGNQGEINPSLRT